MLKRLAKRPMLWALLLIAACASWSWRPLDRSALFPVRFSDLSSGYVTADGRVAIRGKWRDAGEFRPPGVACVVNERKHGIIDRSGELIVPMDYDDLIDSDMKDSVVAVRQGAKWGMINLKGDFVLPLKLDNRILFLNSKYARANLLQGNRGWYGLVDRQGKLVIPIEWDAMLDFDAEGLVGVCKDDKWGFIDLSGAIVVPLQWDEVNEFDASGLTYVEKDRTYGFINRKGEIVIPLQWDHVRPFHAAPLARVCRNMKWGFIDRAGKLQIPLQWDEAGNFSSEGLAPVCKDSKWGFIDRNGQVVIPIQWDGIDDFDSEGVALVALQKKWGAIDRTGRTIIPLEWDLISEFRLTGLASVKKNGMFGLMDRTGRLIVPCEWDDVQQVSDGGIHRVVVDRAQRENEHAHWREVLAEWCADILRWNLPQRAGVCHFYDTDGRLLWSSDSPDESVYTIAISIIAAIVIALDGVLLVRRWRRASRTK